MRKHARSLSVYWACRLGSVHCRSDANRRLRQLMSDGQEFHQNIRSQLYCAALRSANSNDFDFVWNRMLSSQDTSQRYQLIESLGCTTSRMFLNELLRASLDPTVFEYNEANFMFQSIYGNGVSSLEITLDFLILNALEAFQRFGENGPYFLLGLAYRIRSNDLIAKVCDTLST